MVVLLVLVIAMIIARAIITVVVVVVVVAVVVAAMIVVLCQCGPDLIACLHGWPTFAVPFTRLPTVTVECVACLLTGSFVAAESRFVLLYVRPRC